MKNGVKSAIIIGVICVLLILIPSCKTNENTGGSTGENGGNNVQQESTTAADPNLRENTPDSLPADLNFNGEAIRILYREAIASKYIGSALTGSEIYAESENGDVVNDAVYKRNQKVEDRLNIKIVPVPCRGDWDDRDTFLNTVKNSVNSGSDDFDIIAGYAYYITSLAPEGVLYNLKNVNYLQPGAEWWSASCADQMTLDNKLYYITGDLALTLLQNTFVVYFDKQVAQNCGLENPYQTVLDGDWTLDKMDELTKGLYKDVNGDGKPDVGDMYGFATTTGNYVDALYNAFDQPIVTKDADGNLQLALNTPKMVDIINKTYSFFYENENSYAISEYNDGADASIQNMFVENRVLFMNGTLGSNDVLRAMNSDYGIIPYPKWNKDQPDYYTGSQNSYSLFSIPATCQKIDAVGAAMEALCSESYRTVTPAYYEIALKKKYSRDDETSQMLDIIRSGITFNFGILNSINIDNIQGIFRDLMTEKKTDFTSRYEKSAQMWQKSLDKLIEKYQNLP